jgi:diacylglycerol O-acyltransferase / wax synthase
MCPTRRDGESLSNVDAAWLRMETSTNLMTITALMTFDEPLDFQQLKTDIEDRLLLFDRFRQKVVHPRLSLLGRPRWVEDEHFALRSHLRRVALPHPGDQGTLQDLVSELMSTPLDYSKPLWQMHVVENYKDGWALVSRIHHCIGDGIALVRLMFSLVDETPEAPPGRRDAATEARASDRTRPTGRGFGLDALLSPTRAIEVARTGVSAASEFGKLLTMGADPKTPLKGNLGVSKKAAWSRAISLAEVKAHARDLDATINDFLLAAVAGALRRYLIRRGHGADGLTIRAVVPVNLRPLDDPVDLGNRFGLVFLGLPIGLTTPVARIAALKREMDRLKASPQAIVAFTILNALGMASPEIEHVGVKLFAQKATAVMTNVPGPRKRLYLAGKPIRDIMFWVPQSGRLGLGVSILSYAGEVRIGIATDAGLVPDPGAIVADFQDELDEMWRAARTVSAR